MIHAIAKKVRVGILTASGDSPGLNAAIRWAGKAALGHYGMEFVGLRDDSGVWPRITPWNWARRRCRGF